MPNAGAPRVRVWLQSGEGKFANACRHCASIAANIEEERVVCQSDREAVDWHYYNNSTKSLTTRPVGGEGASPASQRTEVLSYGDTAIRRYGDTVIR
jgi:hypothetical protein